MVGNMKAQCVGRTTRFGGGFTLIELLIVIVIIGISAAIAVPLISSAASMQIRAAGGIVAADLEYAKSMAISRGQRHSVEFHPNDEWYEIVDSGGNAIVHPITKKNEYVVNFSADGRLDRVTIDSAVFGGAGSNTVIFDSLGSPDDGGTVVLRAGDFTRTVTVEPVTGFISVSE